MAVTEDRPTRFIGRRHWLCMTAVSASLGELVACHSDHADRRVTLAPAIQETRDDARDEPEIPETRAEPTVVPADLRVQVERAPSPFGGPKYVMTIFASGFVQFHGMENVAITGHAEAWISNDQIAALVEELENSPFWEIDQHKLPLVNHAPFAELSATCRGREQSLFFCCMPPSELGWPTPSGDEFDLTPTFMLSDIAEQVETIVGCDRWVQRSTSESAREHDPSAARDSMAEWTGNYRKRTSVDTEVELELLPDGRFTLRYPESIVRRGVFECTRGRIRLELGDWLSLCPVRWGDRRYLLLEQELVAFCNLLNARRYGVLQGVRSSYLVRCDAGADIPTTEADVPEQYRRCIKSPPIIARVMKTTRRAGRGPSSERIVVTIDAGSDQGLVRGLELFLSDDRISASLTITKVTPRSSWATWSARDLTVEPPAPGTFVSTSRLN